MDHTARRTLTRIELNELCYNPVQNRLHFTRFSMKLVREKAHHSSNFSSHYSIFLIRTGVELTRQIRRAEK